MHASDKANDGLIPSDFIDIPPRALLDRDCLLLAIESSIRVRAHAHFFSWTQGALQTILPHDMLLCAAYGRDGSVLFADVMAVQPLQASARDAMLRPSGGLLSTLAAQWNRSGHSPIVFSATDDDARVDPHFRALLRQLGIENIVAHGSFAADGSVDAFFGFADVAAAADDAVGLIVEIILPHLRAALIRMQKKGVLLAAPSRGRGLTEREREVLRLLQHGRSNAEIGALLSISPLTVKNHVQKLLRKLGVRNRTQAVAMDVSQRWRGPE